jgi:hypothetical protein
VNKGRNAACEASAILKGKLGGETMEDGYGESHGEKEGNEEQQKASPPYAIEFVLSIFDDEEGNNEERNQKTAATIIMIMSAVVGEGGSADAIGNSDFQFLNRKPTRAAKGYLEATYLHGDSVIGKLMNKYE